MQNVYMGLDVEDFIFSENSTGFEDPAYAVSDEELNEFGVIECVEDADVACYRIALENEQNYNAIMTAMLTREYSVLESTGSEMVYEAGKIKEFFGWIKKQIQKFWAKVQGVFKKVMDTIGSIVLSNKAFIKKYRSVQGAMKKPADGAKFEGYEFGNLEIYYEKLADAVAIESKKEINESLRDASMKDADRKEKRAFTDEVKNHYRGILIGASGGVSTSDYDEQLRLKLYGSAQPVKIALKDFKTLLDELESAKDVKKDAQDGYKEAQKSIKKFLKNVKECEDKLSGKAAEQGAKNAKFISEMVNFALNTMSQALSVQTRAITAKATQDRKMANYYVRGQQKSVNASAIEEDLGLNVTLV